MKITDALEGEHGVLNALLEHLKAKLLEAVELDFLHKLGAMLEAALASHARLEEELLFSTLDPHLAGAGPLVVMRMEHEEIEGALAKLPSAADLEQGRGLLGHVINTASDHFTKEEQVLFPMAERLLGEPELTRLGTEWAQRRAVTLA